MKLRAVLTLIVPAALLLSLSLSTLVWAQPELTLLSPQDGAVLAEPPRNIHVCFAAPVDNADNADFRFRVLMPDGRGLGLRIVFQSDGLGVDVQPGIPENPPEGEWTFEWRVSDAVTKAPASGTVHFQVRPGGSPIAPEPPQPCTATTGTPAASNAAGGPDGGPDALTVSLIIAGAVGAAAVALLLTWRRISARRHRPSPLDDEGG